jgi:hypothetical protein
MSNTVFFSWQADTPTKVGRNLIERALKRAASRIGDDTSVEDAIRGLSIDRDTKDVPGSPPIVDTIFRKIDKAAVFVPDLTFVGSRFDERPTPNPNVLIEYGWALKSVTHSRIIPVMNTAYGEPTQDAMPFNLRHLRNPIVYHCPADAGDEVRKQARDQLASRLEQAIRAVLASDEFQQSLPQPTPAAAFSPRAPEEGLGRFRTFGNSIGISSGSPVRQQADVYLPAGPIIWLRVMPKFDLGRKWPVTELAKCAWPNGPVIEPLCYSIGDGLYKVRGDDGFGVYSPLRGDPYEAGALSFVFTTAEVWGINLNWLPRTVANGEKYIPNVENLIGTNLQSYGTLLTKLGVPFPYAWTAGMEDTKNRILITRSRYTLPGSGPRCASERVTAEGTYSPPEPAAEALRPLFTAIFDACGAEWPGPQNEP